MFQPDWSCVDAPDKYVREYARDVVLRGTQLVPDQGLELTES
jgi:hypothetical protein